MTETKTAETASRKQKRGAANQLADKESLPPGLAKPALRALAAAGYTDLERFTKVREEELKALHGMGRKAIGIIREALKARGQAFKP